MMVKLFRTDNPTAMTYCRDSLRNVFEQIAEKRIRHRTTRFINGDDLSVEDLAVCALAAPIVLPNNYAEGKFTNYFRKIQSVDNEFCRELEYYRSTDLGKYVLDVYENHRLN